MFGIRNKTSCPIDTVIGAQTRLEGDISFAGGLHIDGVVKGSIVAAPGSESVLTISENGRIEGDVRVPNLVLNGAVEGDVHAAGRVELASHARVTGNVYYHLLEMAMGAEVNGSLVHRGEAAPQAAANDETPALADAAVISAAK